MKNLKDSNVFLRFLNDDTGLDVFVTVSDIVEVGVPIDDNGDDMERVDDRIYIEVGAKFVPVTDCV